MLNCNTVNEDRPTLHIDIGEGNKGPADEKHHKGLLLNKSNHWFVSEKDFEVTVDSTLHVPDW